MQTKTKSELKTQEITPRLTAKLKILCVIPARIGSTRLPRKPLLKIAGKPMIQRTYEKARQCAVFDRVVVATDSEEIAAAVRECGGGEGGNDNGAVEMTDVNIKTGTDRVAAVAERYPDMDVVVNLQGDEPFIQPAMLTALVQPYLDGENPPMSTLAHPLDFATEYQTPDIVKVLCDQHGYALYFSRAPIPYFRQERSAIHLALPVFHHMGVYAFRRQFLLQYTKLSQTSLELAESLEQLRALENGYKIRVCCVAGRTVEINTEEDLRAGEKFAASGEV